MSWTHDHIPCFLLASFAFLALSCEREILTEVVAEPTDGYMIRGHVYDRIYNPMPNVAVTLDYGMTLIDMDGPPTQTYSVPSPGETIVVTVTRRSGQIYVTYPPVSRSPGNFSFTWDKKNGAGNPAPPGVYFVRYSVGSVVKLEYPVTVTGTRVATTDSLGRYSIPNENLPVDFYPVPQYSGDGTRYFGNYRITDLVYLDFTSATAGSFYRSVNLTKDRVVEFDVRFN